MIINIIREYLECVGVVYVIDEDKVVMFECMIIEESFKFGYVNVWVFMNNDVVIVKFYCFY